MTHRKDILTTGEVARICHVAPRTVSKWFDSGQLRGYRIPGSKDRRIPVDQLLRFMAAHGIPMDNVVVGPEKVLILDSDVEFAEALKRALKQRRYDVMIAESAFEAGALVQVHKPNIVIVDVELPDVHPPTMCRFFHSASELQSSMLVAMAAGMTPSMGESLLQQGFGGYLPKPFTLDALLAIIQSVEVG
ncbi:MAG: response regulator [Planctomycetes bacterium]|nr:response regulator [Planctomycetota bacterium]